MRDAPSYRIWPPIALGVPLGIGLGLTAAGYDPVALPKAAAAVIGWVLIVCFGFWNGWALILMARHETALLPGGSTRTILDRGPFRASRNPLYLGLIALTAGVALVVPSFWGLIGVPVGAGLLWWGAIVSEERYLDAKFGEQYRQYRTRVRRWL
ncbi:MAG: isoprenylcysteine carboxylmethyltransferase family protein [Propionicimonas sp.]